MNSNYTILLYHGIHADDVVLSGRNSSGKHIPRSRFESEMAWLSDNRPVVSMADIANSHAGRSRIPDGAVAVTFDDGFRNNYTSAWPVLEKYGIPATIYLATGFISSDRMIWSDRLEATIFDSKRESITVPINGSDTVFNLETTVLRQKAFLDIKAYCKSLGNKSKSGFLNYVEAVLDVSPSADHPLYEFMSWDEVREMDASPLIEFGAHTVDHVSLAKVEEAEMRRQISTSVQVLSEELRHPCQFFSYPEGQPDDYNDSVIEQLKALGFDHSPTAINGANDLGSTDPFHIKRIMVGFENQAFPFEMTGQ